VPCHAQTYATRERIDAIEAHETAVLPVQQKGMRLFGALAIRLQSQSVVLRASLRYSHLRLDDSTKHRQPLITLCSHEEAEWIKRSIARRWDPVRIHAPYAKTVEVSEGRLVIGSTDGASIGFQYRHDLDGGWVNLEDSQRPVDVIRLTSTDGAFGWLLPESSYEVNCWGRTWPNLASLWRSAVKHAVDPGELYRHLYRLRLAQHANLYRRFQELKYPVRCANQLWLARQLYAMRSG